MGRRGARAGSISPLNPPLFQFPFEELCHFVSNIHIKEVQNIQQS